MFYVPFKSPNLDLTGFFVFIVLFEADVKEKKKKKKIKLRRSKFDNQRPLNPGDLLASIMASLSFLLRCISNVFGIPHISSVPSVCCKICLLEIESLHQTVLGRGVAGKVPETPNHIPN